MTDRIDSRVQFADDEETLRVAIDSVLAGKFGSLPVEAVEDSQDGNTVKLKATVKIPVQGPDGQTQWMELPEFHDVLAQHPGANGVTTTFPIKKGDTGTISFQGLGYSNWHQSGGVQNAVTTRNALSDGVFRPGGRAVPQKLKAVSKDSVQTRTDDKKSVHDVSHTAVTAIREEAAHQVNANAIQAQKGGASHVVDGKTIQNVAGKILLNC